MQRLALAAVAASLLAGCATVPTGPRVAVMPGPQKDFAQFQADQAMCQQFAQNSIGGTPQDAAAQSAVASALIGTAIGAAAGAIMGSATGYAGQAAAWGAGTGLLFGSAAGANAAGYSGAEAQRRYDIAYSQCMYAQGNQVPGQMAMRAPVQQQRAAPAIPPPNTPAPTLSGNGQWVAPAGSPPARVPAPRVAPPGSVASTAPPPVSGAPPPSSATPGFGVPSGPVEPGPPRSIAPPAGGTYPPSMYPPPGTPAPEGVGAS